MHLSYSRSHFFMLAIVLALLPAWIQCIIKDDSMIRPRADTKTSLWGPGTNIRLFVTKDETITACAPDLGSAEKNVNLFPIWANAGKIVTMKPAADKPSTSLSFRLVNGFLAHTSGYDTAGQTYIQASAPSATGGGCWKSVGGGAIETHECGLDRMSQFYLSQEDYGGGLHMLHNADIGQLVRDSVKNMLVVSTTYQKANICLYHTITRLPLLPPPKDYRFTTDSITRLIGAKIPPATQPMDETDLPGCKSGDLGIDCLISKAINSFPTFCNTDPKKRRCVLLLAPAFCLDVPARRIKDFRAAEWQAEGCMRRVSQGPCSANPSGAACLSGLFNGVAKWLVPRGIKRDLGSTSDTEGITSLDLYKRDILDSLFSEKVNQYPIIEQFFIGILKNLANAAIEVSNLFRQGLVNSARMNCYGMTNRIKATQQELDKLRQGCSETFSSPTPIGTIQMVGQVEKAGDLFADIVMILFTVGDVVKAVQAAKWVGKAGEVVSKFAPRAFGRQGGKILEAKGTNGVVQVFNDYGNGKPVAYFTDEAVADVKAANAQDGFANCKTCKTKFVSRGGLSKLLCCFGGTPRVSEMVSDPPKKYTQQLQEQYQRHLKPNEAIPLPERKIGPLHTIAKDPTNVKTLGEGVKQHSLYYKDGRPPPVKTDPVNQVFYKAADDMYKHLAVKATDFPAWHATLTKAAKETWNIDVLDVQAVRQYIIHDSDSLPGLATAMRKLNPITESWVIKTQVIPDELLAVLKKGGPGLKSKGPPGLYTLEDLVRTGKSSMSTSLGMFPVYNTATEPYRFVIKSATGRYIPPITGSHYHEVLFNKELAGKFKLLGYEDLNGGVEAMNGGRPPFGVFYFEEVTPPPFTPKKVKLPVIRW